MVTTTDRWGGVNHDIAVEQDGQLRWLAAVGYTQDGDFRSPEQIEADARLMAVAPKLLQLAEQYASECGECAGTGTTIEDRDCANCRFIRDAIAQAKGLEVHS